MMHDKIGCLSLVAQRITVVDGQYEKIIDVHSVLDSDTALFILNNTHR